MKQIFLKFENNKLVLLSNDEKKLFGRVVDYKNDVNDAGVEGDIYVSFKQEHKEKEMSVSLWADQFAVCFKYSELMALLEVMKDQNKMKMLVAAEGV